VYSISEVSRLVGLSVHTLRFYEAEDLLVFPVGRDPGGRRRYQEVDVAWLRMLIRLRETGMPIEEIRLYIAHVRAGAGTEPERLALLLEHRRRVCAQIEALHGHLDALDTKIELYSTAEPAVQSG
jgi:DNA-binding transcriptional MerR regulator